MDYYDSEVEVPDINFELLLSVCDILLEDDSNMCSLCMEHVGIKI